MRYLSTPHETVERLKKQAKKLQRSGAGKHSDLLNRVAKQAGYDHWDHVVHCNEAVKAVGQMRSIRDECEAITIAAALRGKAKALVTKDGVGCPPFVLFSTGIGDAWLLEPDEALAMCLVWQGERQALGVSDNPERIEVEWDGAYELLGDFFHVESRHPVIGTRAIGGYPLEDVRKLLDKAQSTMMKMAAVMGQVDAVDITPEVVAQVPKQGWSEPELMRMKAEEWRYSPSRNSLLGPSGHERRGLGPRRRGGGRRSAALRAAEPTRAGLERMEREDSHLASSEKSIDVPSYADPPRERNSTRLARPHHTGR